MDAETLELFKSFKQTLIGFLQAFRLQQNFVYELTVSLQSLLDVIAAHDPMLAQKFRDAYPIVALGSPNDANLQVLQLIDGVMEQLKKIDER